LRIIARSTLQKYINHLRGHKDQPAVQTALNAWYAEAHKARWANSAELKQQYASASLVSGDRVVFNIKGNDYRLIVAIDYRKSLIWIKWIGTHQDYDKIDAAGVEYHG